MFSRSNYRLIRYRSCLLGLTATGLIFGCANQKVYTLSDDGQSVAHEQAYITDSFQLDKGFESRDTDPQFMFFYKECELEKRRVHVSRVEYSCRKLPYQIYW